MPFSMTTNAVAVTDIVVQFLLEFARYKFPLNGGRQIRSLEPLREGSGEFMGGALLGLVGLRVRLFLLFSCACVEVWKPTVHVRTTTHHRGTVLEPTPIPGCQNPYHRFTRRDPNQPQGPSRQDKDRENKRKH